MIRNFFSTPNVIGRLVIVLLFAGGVVFAGAFDGFVVETEASNCCGGGTSMDIFSSSSCCDEDPEPEPCECLGRSECSEEVCADENTECKTITSCHPDCGNCHLNDAGRPCTGGVHCSNEEDSDDYVCDGGCMVPN